MVRRTLFLGGASDHTRRATRARGVLDLSRLAADERSTPQQALRARFYEGYALLQAGRFEESISVFEDVTALGGSRSDSKSTSLVEGARIQRQRAQAWLKRRR